MRQLDIPELSIRQTDEIIEEKVVFPPGLTFLASVFGTFLTYFSDPTFQAGYLEEFKVLTLNKIFVAGGSRTRVVSVTDTERYPIRPRSRC